MLRFRFPEVAGGRHLGDDLGRPQAGGVDVGDGVDGDALLLVGGVENRRAVAAAEVVTLTVLGARIVDLEEEFQQFAEADHGRVEDDFQRFGVAAVVAVGGVLDVAAAVADAAGDDAGPFADQILHAPKAAAGEYGTFCSHGISFNKFELARRVGRGRPSENVYGTRCRRILLTLARRRRMYWRRGRAMEARPR